MRKCVTLSTDPPPLSSRSSQPFVSHYRLFSFYLPSHDGPQRLVEELRALAATEAEAITLAEEEKEIAEEAAAEAWALQGMAAKNSGSGS